MSLQARLATVVGHQVHAYAWWGEGCVDGAEHYVRHHIETCGDRLRAERALAEAAWQEIDWTGALCTRCGAEAPAEVRRGGAGTSVIYDTPTGKLEEGCLFWNDWYPHGEDGQCRMYGWTNCDGLHLMAVVPGGAQWDIDSRAANCTRPDDGIHRCWIRTGEPPNVTVGKDGDTCSAGAGSIVAGDYHGFLRDGVFT